MSSAVTSHVREKVSMNEYEGMSKRFDRQGGKQMFQVGISRHPYGVHLFMRQPSSEVQVFIEIIRDTGDLAESKCKSE